MKDCLRCGTLSEVSAIGAALVNFVCDPCRRDTLDFDYKMRLGGIPISSGAMVYQTPVEYAYDKQESLKERVPKGFLPVIRFEMFRMMKEEDTPTNKQ